MSEKPQTWLILSHAFNMDGRAASQTITDKIPHLLDAGITPVVISAKTGRKDPHLEHYQLLPLGPAGLRFDLRHVLRKRWGKDWRYRLTTLLATILLTPGIIIEKFFWPLESHWSWWYPAYRKGLKLIRQGRIDVIYSTGGAYAAHKAGAMLKKTTGLPWVAEVHDPLVLPGNTPTSGQHKMQAKIEDLICNGADLPFWFTDQALLSARKRHPGMGDKGKMILPGVDAPTGILPDYRPGEVMVIGHFGSLSPTRHLGGVIEAIARATERQPELKSRVELHIYGTDLDALTQAAMQKHADTVTVRNFGRLEHDPVSGKSGRQQVLEKMRMTDILLLHHGIERDCEEYFPSKLYEYLWMKRPILGLVHHNPQLAELLQKAGHRVVAADDIAAQAKEIGKLFLQWSTTGLPDLSLDNPYSTKAAVAYILLHFKSLTTV
jgi:glycosyltransferase involved in cell wall biosynthesis